jgi:chemotaxis protein methyltransferase CheR
MTTTTEELRHIRFVGEPVSARSHPKRQGLPGGNVVATVVQPVVLSDPFLIEVLRMAGLEPAFCRDAPLRRRLLACLRAVRAANSQEALEQLRAHPERLDELLGAGLISTSAFFRGPAVFAFLRESLPAFARTRGGALRIWSAGCAQGEELYSVALLLAEVRLQDKCTFLGTDCCRAAFEAARQSLYSVAELAAVRNGLREQYSTTEGAMCRVVSSLRDLIRWKVHDVLADPGPDRWDVSLCRNLAIYLSPAGAERLWKNLTGQLEPGGLLIVGNAERPYSKALARAHPCVYRKGEEGHA